jgi:hypothetical protein
MWTKAQGWHLLAASALVTFSCAGLVGGDEESLEGHTPNGDRIGQGGASQTVGGAIEAAGERTESSETAGSGGANTAEVCDVIELKRHVTPINVVVMLDKSESMGHLGDYESTWTPLCHGIRDFFTSTDDKALYASLSYVPCAGGITETCSSEYTTPNVALTPLSSPEALVKALDAVEPSGGSPTLSAAYGATAYAKKLMDDDPGSRSLVVLVTDGEPAMFQNEDGTTGDLAVNGTPEESSTTACVPSALQGTGVQNTVDDIAAVLAEAATSDPMVPTYVVGVGWNQTALKVLANAGGTDLIVPDMTDPTSMAGSISSTLTATVDHRPVSSYVCGVDIDPPESGIMPDPEVSLVYPDGTVSRYPRSDTCAIAGWHYDNLDSPTAVQFCPQLCTELQRSTEATLRVVVFCG